MCAVLVGGIDGEIAIKAIIDEVTEDLGSVTIRVVTDDGVILNNIRGFPVNSNLLWKWDESKVPFLPEGKTLREEVYLHKLGLPQDIIDTFTYYHIYNTEEVAAALRIIEQRKMFVIFGRKRREDNRNKESIRSLWRRLAGRFFADPHGNAEQGTFTS